MTDVPDDWADEDDAESARDSFVRPSELKPLEFLSRRYAPNSASAIERRTILIGKSLYLVGLFGVGSYLLYSVVDNDPVLSFFLAMILIGVGISLLVSRE